jgi:CheY-like chemotaxis protein
VREKVRHRGNRSFFANVPYFSICGRVLSRFLDAVRVLTLTSERRMNDPMKRSRVLLADDHAATTERWRDLLEPEFDIVATVADGGALIEANERLHPDVIVTDVVMPGLSGIAAAEKILRRHPAARIVFVTVHADRAMLRRGLAVGAFGYVLKVRVGEDLVPAIRAALRGELLISPFPPLEENEPG